MHNTWLFNAYNCLTFITDKFFVKIAVNNLLKQSHNKVLMFFTCEQAMAKETIFSKIIRQEISTPLLYQDELVTAFRDISPQANCHILIIPNKLIPTVNDVSDEDELALGRMISVAKKLAVKEGIAGDGFRLIVNCNKDGGQEVYHLHMHLVGGQAMGPMINVPKANS